MRNIPKPIFVLILLALWLAGYLYFSKSNIALFNPQGAVAGQESILMKSNIALMMVVGLTVLVLIFFTAWRYRIGNHKAKYLPEWTGGKLIEILSWIIPTIVILAMSWNLWFVTHKLDPYKPIASAKQPITIQVVALQWKWLFLYPKQNIATVNYIEFPAGTPIKFELTADAPMNSFWIPQLGGQMYAMAGMSTQLHLIADNPGEYAGSAAEISGEGFSGMKFVAKSTTQDDFDTWVKAVKTNSNTLAWTDYTKLVQPSENDPVSLYSSYDPNLYNEIMNKFMSPNHGSSHTHGS